MTLLKRPEFAPADDGRRHLPQSGDPRFRNSPPTDFADANARFLIQAEIDSLMSARPATVRPIVSGREVPCAETIVRGSPQAPDKLKIAEIWLADKATAERAIEETTAFFPTFRDTPVSARAPVLTKTAEILESIRKSLAALITLEAGKP